MTVSLVLLEKKKHQKTVPFQACQFVPCHILLSHRSPSKTGTVAALDCSSESHLGMCSAGASGSQHLGSKYPGWRGTYSPKLILRAAQSWLLIKAQSCPPSPLHLPPDCASSTCTPPCLSKGHQGHLQQSFPQHPSPHSFPLGLSPHGRQALGSLVWAHLLLGKLCLNLPS